MVGIVATYLLSYQKIDQTRAIILSLLSMISILINAIAYGDLIIGPPPTVANWSGICWSFGISLLAFFLIFLFNYFVLKPFGRAKLDKKILAFTQKANPNSVLKIMAGDLTFFGDIKTMESNPQVQQLMILKFKQIMIVAKSPNNEEEKIRIGKLIDLLKESAVQIKFYDQTVLRDLHLRFRCITLGNNTTAIMNIFKFSPGKEYTTEELYVSASNQEQVKRHQTFEALWDVYWKALKTDAQKTQECMESYRRFFTQLGTQL